LIYLEHLLAATHGELRYQGKHTHFDAFSHDTRQLIPAEMFVAVRGERRDGHDYILDAIHRGATGLLVEARILNTLPEEMLSTVAQVATVVVEDTRLALQQYAHAILQRWHPKVIAVTGSVGKTSTKEAIATVLASSFSTFRSWQNYNDLLGIPLSLGRLEPHHEYAVLELGCDHPGEIAALCRIVQPQSGIITTITPIELHYFGTLERLAAELGTLPQCLPEDGLFLFAEENTTIRALLPTHTGPTITTFSRHEINQSRLQITWDGLQTELTLPGKHGHASHQLPFSSHLLGEHHLNTMLIAYHIGIQQGIPPQEVLQTLSTINPMLGRLNPLPGVLHSRILDDTHNASPASLQAGLATIATLTPQTGRRIAILGDMFNLGDYEEEAHRAIGYLVPRHADYLITRGERAAWIAEAALQAGLPTNHAIVTYTHEDAAKAARTLLESADKQRSSTTDYDVLLIKGSEPARMERVTEMLLAEPTRAPELLVRQTPGWKQIVVMRPQRPTWLEIDLSAIANNTRLIKTLVGPHVRVMTSLKADAYGHGALKVARTVLHNGASMLGVATVSEATPLRDAGIDAPILVYGYIPHWQMREAVRLDITATLYASESAQALSRAALALGKTVKVHVKVDTGMGRLGIRHEQLDEIVALVRDILSLPALELEGIYTHFASADTHDQTHARLQLARFQHVLSALTTQGLHPPIVHAANSAATLSLPEAHFDMVRPGTATYGLDPSSEVRLPEGFRAALSFKTQVSQVKWVPEGECISYGCTYITEHPTRIAVLPVGYADGFRRAPKNWGSVLIRGQEAPILGRVCMDQCMVDVTHIPETRMGDEVVLIGHQGNASLSAEQVAERLGTINYEVVSEILARVPRVD
jgi:Alr-MurF fusion protein